MIETRRLKKVVMTFYTMISVLYEGSCFNALDYVELMSRSVVTCGRLLAAFWDFSSWFWTVLYSLKIFSVLKVPVSLDQDRATVEVFNNRFFVCASKCKNLFSVRHYLHFCLISCALHCSGKECTFFILFLLLLT